MAQLDPNSLLTFAQQLSETANTAEIALRNWQPGEMFYTYYHLNCAGPVSGYNTNINLAELTSLSLCASCGGNIHEAPRKE